MPTVLRVGRYRFFFYSNEDNEPPHIHVRAESDQASNYGFRAHELNEIETIVQEHQMDLLEAWNERPG